ncbi:hypothetical protein GuangZ0019_0215 [Mycobacterium tuberculosis GuangZ0019]|nr:hypothetical protein GuangZ0019_0215 [Mycobacterium tuberculosis GuangZ0019]
MWLSPLAPPAKQSGTTSGTSKMSGLLSHVDQSIAWPALTHRRS